MIFTSNDFKGFYPVGVAAVVEAPDARQAKRKLIAALEAYGLPQKAEFVSVREFKGEVAILCDGNY